MALGLGYGLPFAVKRPVQGFAEDVALAAENALADAGQREVAGNCLAARTINVMQSVQTQPSLLVVPQLYKAGVLYEQLPTTRTNFLPNNAMLGATGSVLPSGWSINSLPAGLTVSYSASGQTTAADGTVVDYIDFTLSGTAAASGFLNLRPNASISTIVATSGQTWNTSVFLALISGSVASILPTWQLQETTSGGGFLQGSNISGLGSLVSGGALERYNVSRTLTDATTERVQVRWGHLLVSGTSYNYTLRIASPQLERLGRVTPMIRTGVSVTGAVTVLNESSNVVGLPPDFTVTRDTTARRVNQAGLIESVASGVPRIDWLGQSCPSLLVEPSGQNLALQSAGFEVSGTWAPTNISVSTGTTAAFIAPDGSTDADLLTATASGSARIIQSFSFVSGTTYTYSAFAKAGSGFFGLTMENGGVASGAAVIWNLNTGAFAVSGTQGSGYTLQAHSIENYGNGWYRCKMTVLMSVSVAGNIRANTSDGTMSSTVIQSASGNTAYVWGAQLEAGSVATTYIPTTSGSVTRNADQITASGALVSGLIGQTVGTIYCEFAYFGTPVSRSGPVFLRQADLRGLSINFAPTDSPAGIRFSSRNNAGETALNIVSGTLQIGTYYKVAIAYDAGGTAAGGSQASGVVAYVNGVQTAIGTFRVPDAAGLTQFWMYAANAGASNEPFNGRIRASALYTTRLTNDQLAQLTKL